MIEIPKEIKGKLYIYLDTNCNWNPFSFFNFEITSPDKILLHTIDLDIILPEMSLEEIQGKLVLSLRKQKDELINRHLDEVAKLDDKISQLLAIEYNTDKEEPCIFV